MNNSAERLAKHILGPKAKVNDVLSSSAISPDKKRQVLAELRKHKGGKTKEAQRQTLIVKLAKHCGTHTKKMPSYDKGGEIKSDGYLTDNKGEPYARVHKGETVVPASDTEAKIMKVLTDEGGAAGMKAIKKHVNEPDLKSAMASLMKKRKIFKHEDGDIIKKAAPFIKEAKIPSWAKQFAIQDGNTIKIIKHPKSKRLKAKLEMLQAGRLNAPLYRKDGLNPTLAGKPGSGKPEGGFPKGSMMDLLRRAAGREKTSAANRDPRLARAGVAGYNKPRRTPGHPTKSHIVVAKEGDRPGKNN